MKKFVLLLGAFCLLFVTGCACYPVGYGHHVEYPHGHHGHHGHYYAPPSCHYY